MSRWEPSCSPGSICNVTCLTLSLHTAGCWLLLRVGDVDGQVEGGADDEVELVPAALVPVQAGPGDHPLQQGRDQVMVSSVSSSYVLC